MYPYLNFSGCYHVYLDVGSNIGMQTRKLYEPQLFNQGDPPVKALYEKLFGVIEK